MARTLIICDIQKEYSNGCHHFLFDFVKYLNRAASKFGNVVYFFNGYETLGMSTEGELIEWLSDYGLNENTLDYIQFVDKGYAFLREAMDNDVSDTNIIAALKAMRINNVWSSDLLDNETIDATVGKHTIHWNESFDIMTEQTTKSIVFVGGGIHECLKELMLGAESVGKSYELKHKFVY